MVSPMYFSRNGRDHPIPDPVLIVGSLARRWNSWAPAALTVSDELRDQLCAAVLLADMQGGTVTIGRNQIRFTGTVGLGLPRHAERDIGWCSQPWCGSPSSPVSARRPRTASAR